MKNQRHSLVCPLCGEVVLPWKASYPSVNQDWMIGHFRQKHLGDLRDFANLVFLTRQLRKKYGFAIPSNPNFRKSLKMED